MGQTQRQTQTPRLSFCLCQSYTAFNEKLSGMIVLVLIICCLCLIQKIQYIITVGFLSWNLFYNIYTIKRYFQHFWDQYMGLNGWYGYFFSQQLLDDYILIAAS